MRSLSTQQPKADSHIANDNLETSDATMLSTLTSYNVFGHLCDYVTSNGRSVDSVALQELTVAPRQVVGQGILVWELCDLAVVRRTKLLIPSEGMNVFPPL